MATPTAKFDVVETPDMESLESIKAKVQGYIETKGIDPDNKFVYESKKTLGGYKLVILGRCQAPQRDCIEAFCLGLAAA